MIDAALRAVVADVVAAAKAELLRELPALLRAELAAHRDADLLDSSAMAAKFGKSVEAFNRWIGRKGGAHVLAIAKVDPAGRRYWLRAEVDALTARGIR